ESGGTILVMHPEQPNRDAVPLPITGQGTLVDEGVNASPTWSSDGARIAYASVPRGEQSAAVYVVDVDGSHLRRGAAHGYAPSWSPDGTRIAYSLSSGLRLVTPAGRDVTPPSFRWLGHIGIAGAPAWSPDGRKLAVSDRAGTFVINRDGTHLRQVWT